MLPTLKIFWEHSRENIAVRPSPEARQRFRACEDKIQAQLGLDFVDELDNAWNDIHLGELDRAYEQGFLDAFRLWAEVTAVGGGNWT